ncbi:MAG TPA: transglycosylase SLT domain-containing protein [Thermoanaerobaculia bacterium]|nr:transglycosylase SLT domain-containing protein [Thermoanaerobaculia bacterium]
MVDETRPPAPREILLPVTLAALCLAFLALMFWRPDFEGDDLAHTAVQPPPDLAPFAEPFSRGVDAALNGRDEDAYRALSSFTFGDRPVEAYRLYYLATAARSIGRADEARRILAALWRTRPAFVPAIDAASTLAGIYTDRGADHRAAETWGTIASMSADGSIAAVAREEYLRTRFRTGDLGAVLLAATNLVVENPAEPQAAQAEGILRSVYGIAAGAPIPLTAAQRLRRAETLLQAAKPKAALEELAKIDGNELTGDLKPRFLLARGQALHRTSRYEESERTVEPLFSHAYRWAIPALELSARNRQSLVRSIDPTTYKTVTVRERAGTRLVTRKGKRVRVPNYRNVKKRVEQVDAQKKALRARHEAVYLERLNDLRSLPLEPELRRDVLVRLVSHATAVEDEPLLRRSLTDLIEVAPTNDTGLQYFWDTGWAAYIEKKYEKSADYFNFIASTFGNPNIRRQATYWFARSIERQGKGDDAKEIYRELLNVEYRDLYALFAEERLGGGNPSLRTAAAAAPEVSWDKLAEEEIPDELRLAYELNALGIARDARIEVQKNASFSNRKWADSILGDLYFAEGAWDLSYRYLRRAWPELATPEQNAVPWRFIEMYYPVRYEEEIRRHAAKNELDPYLVMALIRQESAFNPEARSPVGASGLMQLMPATGRELGSRLYSTFTESRLTNPEVNIELGTHYLRRVINLLDGNVELALAGYNGGPYRIRRWRRESPQKPLDEFIEGMPLSETRGYVKRITLLRSSYERLYSHPGTVTDPPAARTAEAR